MKLIFMGTPDFAVAALDALVRNGCNVVGVVTAPDRPAGRGQALKESAVKQYAREKGLPVFQPPKLKDPEFLQQLKSLNADLQVVVAFRMLPEVVWNMPPKGTINLHGSLLPQYRGAAPINWAIINGESESGVTTFFLQQEIDTGNLLFAEKVPIALNETAGELHDKLMAVGANLLLKTVEAVQTGNYSETPQGTMNPSVLKHAPKIFKQDCLINWRQAVEVVYNRIRGLSPYPTAFTQIDGQTLKIFRAEMEKTDSKFDPGSYSTDGKSFLKFACADGFISVTDLQLEGKKRMNVGAFLRGYKLAGTQ